MDVTKVKWAQSIDVTEWGAVKGSQLEADNEIQERVRRATGTSPHNTLNENQNPTGKELGLGVSIKMLRNEIDSIGDCQCGIEHKD